MLQFFGIKWGIFNLIFYFLTILVSLLHFQEDKLRQKTMALENHRKVKKKIRTLVSKIREIQRIF